MNPVRAALLFLALMFTQCSSSGDSGGNSGQTLLAQVDDWGYQLQKIDPEKIGDSDYDLMVVDYSSDGSDKTAFSVEEVSQMRGRGENKKIILAYMSIGEAEDYRYYFDANASYLDEENQNFQGNFKVHYWEPEWQAVIDTYMDRLIEAGFDGAYLDIIDAYEFFGPEGDSGMERESAAQDMVNFVRHIAEYSRAQDSDFLIFPQNGSGILTASGMSDKYLEVVDGIGAEDTFYFGDQDEDNDLDEQTTSIENLDLFTAAGKVVLSVDYLTDEEKINDFYERAMSKNYVPYASIRALDQLTVNDGHEPDS